MYRYITRPQKQGFWGAWGRAALVARRGLADQTIRVGGHREPDEHEDVEHDRRDHEPEPPGFVRREGHTEEERGDQGRDPEPRHPAPLLGCFDLERRGPLVRYRVHRDGITHGHGFGRGCAHFVLQEVRRRPRRRAPVIEYRNW